MHELGLVYQIVKTVEKVAVEEKLEKIESIVLQVGELSLVVPRYLEECFPAAIDRKPMFEDCKLEIEIIPGMAKCARCDSVFNVVENEGYCPVCKCFDKEILGGREFIIKEVNAL